MVTRAPDPPGAFAALSEDPKLISLLVQWPGDDPEQLWEELVGRLEELVEAQRCLRCGTCCRVSSPTLYEDDLRAIQSGHIEKSSLFTLRAGERVHSARLAEHLVLEMDLIKLRERPDGGCLKLDDHLCRDYDSRPLQCRHFECWSGQHGGDLEDRERLTRDHIYADDETARGLIAEFDTKLPAIELTHSVESAIVGDEEAARTAMAFIELDHRLRMGIEERYGYSVSEQELLFGRDAVSVVRGLGVTINLDEGEEPIFRQRRSPCTENH